MMRLKIFRRGKIAGGSITLLWVLQLALTLNTHEGGHATLGVCFGPLEVNVGLTLWDTWLPK